MKRLAFILLVLCTVALCGFILWVMVQLPIM